MSSPRWLSSQSARIRRVIIPEPISCEGVERTDKLFVEELARDREPIKTCAEFTVPTNASSVSCTDDVCFCATVASVGFSRDGSAKGAANTDDLILPHPAQIPNPAPRTRIQLSMDSSVDFAVNLISMPANQHAFDDG